MSPEPAHIPCEATASAVEDHEPHGCPVCGMSANAHMRTERTSPMPDVIDLIKASARKTSVGLDVALASQARSLGVKPEQIDVVHFWVGMEGTVKVAFMLYRTPGRFHQGLGLMRETRFAVFVDGRSHSSGVVRTWWEQVDSDQGSAS